MRANKVILLVMATLAIARPHAALPGGDSGLQWRWQPSLLPKALLVEGMWTDTYRLRESVRRVGMPCEGAYRSTRGVKGLPSSADAYGAFSVIVLSNVDAPAIGNERLAIMRNFVQAGGGLVVLGGFWAFGRGGYHGTPLEEMLPVSFVERGAITSLPKGLALRAAAAAAWPKGCDFSAGPCTFFIHELKAKPGAMVHVLAGDRPALVSWPHGRGRVVVSALTVNGEPPRGILPFWEWADWPKLLGQAMDWAAASRPSGATAEEPTAKATDAAKANYMELLTGDKKDTKAFLEFCDAMTEDMAGDFFDAWKEDPERFSGKEVDALLAAITPFASKEWAPAVGDYLSGLVVDASHRKSALVLLGATGSEEASGALLDALKDPKLASSAARGLGLSGNRKPIAALERAYVGAMRRSGSEEYPSRLDPEAFAGDCADTAAECALALYRLGAAGAVKRLAETYARLHFYRRIFRNSCKMPKWDDDVMHRWKQGKRIEAAMKRLQRDAGPVPESQLVSLCSFARAVRDPVQAEWVRLAMEGSRKTVRPEAWLPLCEAQNGVIARLASVLSRRD